MVWPCGTKIFGRKNRPKKSSFLGVTVTKSCIFSRKNGRNVTWMGSNGYIMHITYLNYVDISPAEPKKIDFQGVQNCKNDTKIGKMDDFLVKNIFHRKSNFTIKIGFGHDPVRLLWGPMGHIHPNTRPYFQKVDNPSIWYGPCGTKFLAEKNRPKNRHFWGSRWQKVAFFHEKWSECDLNGL